MNSVTKQLLATGFAACTALAIGSADAAPISDWKVVSGSPTTTSGLTTDSPTFGNGSANNMDNVHVAGAFGTDGTPDAVTLAVGETLTVTMQVTLDGGTTGGPAGDAYRFSVQNDGGQYALGDNSNWSGGFLLAIPNGKVFTSRTDGAFVSTAGNASDTGATSVITGGAFSGDSATAYTWTLSITRDSLTTVDVVGSFVGGPNGYSAVTTANDVVTSNFTFSAVGIQGSGQSDLDRLVIGNAQYTVVPEPGSLALIGLGGLCLLRRRRA